MSLKIPGLEKISQVAFIVMCLTVTAVGVQRLLPDAVDAAESAARTPPIEPGSKLELHQDLKPASERASLVLALSTNCRFCTESMGFYRRLAELDVVRDGRLRLSVVSLQPVDAMRAYMAEHRLAIGPVVMVRDSGVSLKGTPMVVLVQNGGVVKQSWSGQLGPGEEKALIAEARKLVTP